MGERGPKKYQPYPEYKPSGVEWLGDIPKGWMLKRLKHLARIKNGQDYKSVEAEEGIPVYGSGGPFTFASTFTYDKASVLLGRKGTIDKPLFVDHPFWTVDTMYYTEVNESIPVKFLYYLAMTIQFGRFSTNTALPSMTQEHLGNYSFSTPDDPTEQTKIAAFLDHEAAKIDALIAKQQRLIALLEEKRQAVISHAVTKGLDPTAPLRPSGIEWLGDVPAHWDVKRLKYLCSVSTGNRNTEDAKEDGNYPFFVRSQTVERINSGPYNCEAVLTAGDGAGVGKVYHYIKGRFDCHQRVYMLTGFEELSGKFIFDYLENNFFNVALAGQAKSTVDSLRMPVFLNFEVTVPAGREQGEIVDYISRKKIAFSKLSKKAQSAIALLKERRIALISAAVTGKIDLRDWQPPEGGSDISAEDSGQPEEAFA